MRKAVFYRIYSCVLVLLFLGVTGCSENGGKLTDSRETGTAQAGITARPDEAAPAEEIAQATAQTEETALSEESPADDASRREETEAGEAREVMAEPVMVETDWSDYFDGINGAAVIYEPDENRFQIYNQELAYTRRSPCSTFKIISSLIALESGVIEPDHSVRTWSGEIFWNGEWNRDIDFPDAFHASCVWYFREIIDEIGKGVMQERLNELEYGNCDISDWEGRLNTNNNNPVLTGFWIESSLLISPEEQVEVMERIFGDHTDYSEETLDRLKQVMLLSEENSADISIYGKTGMGKADGIVVDSWYTGFADADDQRIYFCVYLGETENKDVSSARARETAVKIISAYLN